MIISCATNDSTAVRGVWLTNVDSEALFSSAGIKNAVDLCHEYGINTIFVVTWNKGYTLYPSKVMESLIGEKIDPSLEGRDPVKELIEEAHKKNIKVIAWFEFGFSPSHDKSERKILEARPEWAALNKDGELVVKNGFHWLNGFHPDVQGFMLSLIKEMIDNYDLDGIQGDDRLPALPSESGYDEYTVELYKNSHNGNPPPEDHKDPDWIQWRADLLTDFMKTIYVTVKSRDDELIVSMAPSIYPWSKEEYLQDWPRWVEEGYVDLIIPQLYRYEFDRYKKALDEILEDQLSSQNFQRFYPGILLKVGDYYPSEEYLRQMVNYNREKNINGEVFFFYEGLKKYPELFKNVLYTEKIEFPQLTDK
jgi:uncharacterized lipoprotein YddW (UPF0748 family)